LPLDWALAGPDGTFGNRFDDAQATYRVLYASSQRLGCFLETLARFRPDLSLLVELEAIEGENDFAPSGEVPLEWAPARLIGAAKTQGAFADVYGAEWIARLRRELAGDALQLDVSDVDAAALQQTAPRRLTQRVSRIAYDGGFQGIRYRSKYGHDIENWALFEPFQLERGRDEEIQLTDPDFVEALRLHSLRVTAD
jgi:hypothetical protein